MIRHLPLVLLGAASAAVAEPRVDFLSPSPSFLWDSSYLTVADLDADGDDDLIHLPNGSSVQGGDPHAYWIENLGQRRFAPLGLIHFSPAGRDQSLHGQAILSLTGDARLEIFANRQSGGLVEPLALTPDLGRSAPVEVVALEPAEAGLWFALDYDADGRGELLRIIAGAAPNEPAALRIHDTISEGVVHLTFNVLVDPLDPLEVLSAECLDLDGDGDLDLSLGMASGGKLVFERMATTQIFARTPQILEGMSYNAVWCDVNGDGLPDLPHADGRWQENLGGLAFAEQDASPAYDQIHETDFRVIEPRAGQSALVHAIVPMDSGDELVTLPFDSDTPRSRKSVPGSPAGNPIYSRYQDLDGDGHRDLLHSYATDDSWQVSSRVLAVAWGTATGLSAPQPLVATPAMVHRVFAGDFNKDSCADLILGPDSLGLYRLRFNRGAAGLGEAIPLDGLEVPDTRMRLLGTVDMNKDRNLDLVCCYTRLADSHSAVVVIRGRRDGSFVKQDLSSATLAWSPLPVQEGEFVDWDRDGDLDLVGGGVWRENVKGRFSMGERQLVELGSMIDFLGNPVVIGGTITGDLDGDRAPDIISLVQGEGAWNHPPQSMLVAYNDGFGGIEEAVTLPVALAAYDSLGNPTVPGTVAIADLNDDKLPDLWIREVAGYDSLGNPVTADRWLRNPGRGSRNPASWVSAPLPGSVAPGLAFTDFDGDKKPEWIAADGFLKPTRQGPYNAGTFDFAAPLDFSAEPLRTAADFDADGDADFILGGDDSPLFLLHNPTVDGGKSRRAQPIRWQGKPAVR